MVIQDNSALLSSPEFCIICSCYQWWFWGLWMCLIFILLASFLPYDTLVEDVFSASPLLAVISGILRSPRNVSSLDTKCCTHQTNPNWYSLESHQVTVGFVGPSSFFFSDLLFSKILMLELPPYHQLLQTWQSWCSVKDPSLPLPLHVT